MVDLEDPRSSGQLDPKIIGCRRAESRYILHGISGEPCLVATDSKRLHEAIAILAGTEAQAEELGRLAQRRSQSGGQEVQTTWQGTMA